MVTENSTLRLFLSIVLKLVEHCSLKTWQKSWYWALSKKSRMLLSNLSYHPVMMFHHNDISKNGWLAWQTSSFYANIFLGEKVKGTWHRDRRSNSKEVSVIKTRIRIWYHNLFILLEGFELSQRSFVVLRFCYVFVVTMVTPLCSCEIPIKFDLWFLFTW